MTSSIPADLAGALAKAGQLDVAVETGTYLGDSALALSSSFKEVWSVELAPKIYELAKVKVANCPNAHLRQGYSPDVLPAISAEVSGSALYWFDGHGETFGADDLPSYFKQCPVPEEIVAIDAYAHADRSRI